MSPATIKLIATLVGALHEAREFIDGQIDVVDGENGPLPNRAMQVARTIDEALAEAGTV